MYYMCISIVNTDQAVMQRETVMQFPVAAAETTIPQELLVWLLVLHIMYYVEGDIIKDVGGSYKF